MLLWYIVSALFGLSAAAPGDLVQINTPNGQIQGVESLTLGDSNPFYAFRGIRYGQAPVNNLRFRAPVPTQAWSGVYDATKHGSQCVQPLSNDSTVIFGNEDCLFVNVYTTSLSGAPLPVLVWIHGGGFMYQSGDLDLHGADRFLDHGVIVVSINYRLGIFGFMSTEDEVVPGNYGIKDQVLALKWVNNNIAYFGGDPNRVTIYGESAGAASVHYLRQAEPARGLFTGVIAASGNTLNPWSISRNARARAFYIGRECLLPYNSQRLVDCLRQYDAYDLQRLAPQPTVLDLKQILNGLPYAPVLEKKSPEAVYTKFSYVVQQKGDFNPGPLLLGFTSFEARDFAGIPWIASLILLEHYNWFPSSLTPLDMNANFVGRQAAGENIRDFYFQNRNLSLGLPFSYYFSDNEFVRGAVKSSQLQSKYCDVYLYNFSFTGGANHVIMPVDGVAHSEDLEFLFESERNVQHTPEAKLTQDRMVTMWTNFVKTGNPTPIPIDGVTWPLVNAGDAVQYLDIGYDLVPKENPRRVQMEFWETQYGQYGVPPYNNY